MPHPQSAPQVALAARNRRSIRKYLPQPIPPEDLEEILELAGRAPSAWNMQPWRWIVVTDPNARQSLMEAANGQSQVGSAAAVIVVASDMEDAMAKAEDSRALSLPPEMRASQAASIHKHFGAMSIEERSAWGRNQTNIALGWLLLSLEAFGYASSPMLGFKADKVRTLYGLGDHVEIAALVAVGLAGEEGTPSDRLPVTAITRTI